MNEHWTEYQLEHLEPKSLQASKLSSLQAKTGIEMSGNILSTGKDGIIKFSEVI
jgi:hypothetical protein